MAADEYDVPVNAVRFNYYEDDGREYIGRTWLIDPQDTRLNLPVNESRGTVVISTSPLVIIFIDPGKMHVNTASFRVDRENSTAERSTNYSSVLESWFTFPSMAT